MSKLAYRATLEIPTSALKVYSLDFSPCGTKIAAGMDNGNIFVWDTRTGNQYYPALTSPALTSPDTGLTLTSNNASGPSVVLWLDETTFLCGFSDGYLATCHLQQELQTLQTHDPALPKYRLHILRRQVTNEALRYLAYNKETTCVAISGPQKTRLWNRKDLLDWTYWKALTKPSSLEERKSLPLEITSSSWLSNRHGGMDLIVSYLHHGIVIWDVNNGEQVRSINAGGVIYQGAWCSGVQKFVSVNGLRKVDIYDLESGQIWSPEPLHNVSTVRSMHRGTGFVAGCRRGHAELVDIPDCLILETLQTVPAASSVPFSDPADPALAVHQDLQEEHFMIAIAYGAKCMVWRSGPIC